MAKVTFDLWEKIFKAKGFDLSQDLHFITPLEIKSLTGYEPRLMAKMDSTSEVPPVFKENGYFLLSVGSKGYAIVRGNGFHRLEKVDTAAEQFKSRIKFNLTTAGRNSSEMQYLDYCSNAGLIEHVAGDGTLYPSIRGREGSGRFSFKVERSKIEVDAAQIEVDLGLEGQSKVVLIEAKSKTPEDFVIRQLYYPYRRFTELAADKEIVPIFFTYDNKRAAYNYWIYKFEDQNDYNSIKLVSQSSYTILTDDELEINEIQPLGDVRYKGLIPQANDLDKVLELVFRVDSGMTDAASIASHFSFDTRQSSYYREAAEALGLVYKEGSRYHLTETGEHLMSLGAEDRNIMFAKILSNFNLVKDSMDLLKNKGSLNRADIERLVAAKSNLTGSTVGRRASSLMSWFKWLSAKTGTFVFYKDSGEFRLS